MGTAEMKLELIRTIDSFNDAQLKDAISFFKYQYSNHNGDDDKWNEGISVWELDEATREANKGGGKPVDVVLQEIRDKYGFGSKE